MRIVRQRQVAKMGSRTTTIRPARATEAGLTPKINMPTPTLGRTATFSGLEVENKVTGRPSASPTKATTRTETGAIEALAGAPAAVAITAAISAEAINTAAIIETTIASMAAVNSSTTMGGRPTITTITIKGAGVDIIRTGETTTSVSKAAITKSSTKSK